ncbi:hypothetical protein DUNSADRAFT_10632 [Dunaliella salina]|uniref:Uncharacterized protein n=1 Tax=Dunaliella salina TaxID=3046 RepID=A0ABQ7FTD9_DUNSA|nr:hypothetical protein DUNSADRAFT_10632 [Dunaliella salina]|eukprot:KAF5825398.1 hypothetical protein DUNSADRAFT_10632 [Dunaliella salina]
MEPLLLVVQALHGLLSSQAQAMRGLPDQVRCKQREKATLRALLQLHYVTQRALIRCLEAGSSDNSCLVMQEKAIQQAAQALETNAATQNFLDAVSSSSLIHTQLAPRLQQERADSVEAEVQQMKQLVSSLGRLARAIDQATEDLDYSDQNYAYGSTPFCSWAKVRAVMHAPTMESMRIAPMEAFHFVAGPRCGQ